MARFRRRKEGSEEAAPSAATDPADPAAPGDALTPAGATDTQPPGPGTTGANALVPGPEPTVSERLEGQRSWLAQLDRRLGVRTYAGAAALVIAIAAAAVALVLVLQLQDDAATKADLDALREEIAIVEDSATEAAQDDVQTLTERITELEAEVSSFGSEQDSTDRQLSVVEDDIRDLRDQITALDESSSSDSGNGG